MPTAIFLKLRISLFLGFDISLRDKSRLRHDMSHLFVRSILSSSAKCGLVLLHNCVYEHLLTSVYNEFTLRNESIHNFRYVRFRLCTFPMTPIFLSNAQGSWKLQKHLGINFFSFFSLLHTIGQHFSNFKNKDEKDYFGSSRVSYLHDNTLLNTKKHTELCSKCSATPTAFLIFYLSPLIDNCLKTT